MSARLEVGGVGYLGADWGELAELLAHQEVVIPFEDLVKEELVRVYEAGEWWRSDRRQLPGVSWLLDLVRDGSVDFFLFMLPRGVVGLEEGSLGEVKADPPDMLYLLSDHQNAIPLAFNKKDLARTLLYDAARSHDFSRWPAELRDALLAHVRQARLNMLTFARLAAEAGIPRSLLWLRVSEDGSVTAPTCSTEEMGDDSVVLVMRWANKKKAMPVADAILPIFRTWLDHHKQEENGRLPSLIPLPYCIIRSDSEEEVVKRFQSFTSDLRCVAFLDDCWKVLGPLAAVQRAFPELGTFVMDLHVLWKTEDGGVNWKESVVTMYGSEKAMRVLAAVLGDHPDVFKVLIREAR